MNELLSASRPSASRTIGELTVGELTRRRVDMSASRLRRVDHRRVGVGELNCSQDNAQVQTSGPKRAWGSNVGAQTTCSPENSSHSNII
uniref:Uncharacterized protein n=1 Tax=Globodera pallida TaxID=36090 RepID=A0A183C8I8_GLOPA